MKDYIPNLYVYNCYVDGFDTIIDCTFDSSNSDSVISILEEVFEDWEVIQHEDSLEVYSEYCRIFFHRKFMKNETIMWQYYQYVASQDPKIESLRCSINEILLQTEFREYIYVTSYLILHFWLHPSYSF